MDLKVWARYLDRIGFILSDCYDGKESLMILRFS